MAVKREKWLLLRNPSTGEFYEGIIQETTPSGQRTEHKFTKFHTSAKHFDAIAGLAMLRNMPYLSLVPLQDLSITA